VTDDAAAASRARPDGTRDAMRDRPRSADPGPFVSYDRVYVAAAAD
jgi:hypothetical protein